MQASLLHTICIFRYINLLPLYNNNNNGEVGEVGLLTARVSKSVNVDADGTGGVILPDWYLTTECSPFAIDCVSRELRQTKNKYTFYPFPLINENIRPLSSSGNNSSVWKDPSTFPKRGEQSDDDNDDTKEQQQLSYRDTIMPNEEIDECIARAKETSTKEQMDHLLPSIQTFQEQSHEDERVAFTISDYSYSKEMLDDAYAMAHEVMDLRYFFLVAMDDTTIRMACERGYKVLGWNNNNGNSGIKSDGDKEQDDDNNEGEENAYKSKQIVSDVAMSKWKVALEILERQFPIFFFEMDVWFLRSPYQLFQQQTYDVMFSGHQDNPHALNIGIYSVLPTNRSIDFFRTSIDLFEQRPTVHDQFVMQQILAWADTPNKSNLKYDKQWGNNVWGESPPPIPDFPNGYVTHANFPSWAIARVNVQYLVIKLWQFIYCVARHSPLLMGSKWSPRN